MVEAIKNRFSNPENFYLPVAVIYFFLNCLFLPEGLQYTTLLTPLFLWYLYKTKPVVPYVLFFAITSAYAIIHFKLGVQPIYYLRSWFLAFCSFTFALTVYQYFKQAANAEKIFDKIALYNLFLVPVAFVALFIHPVNQYFWYYKAISPGIEAFPRLSMLTYEASYYGLLFAPVYLYLLLKIFLNRSQHLWRHTAMVIIPLTLSLSFGIIATLAIAMAVILTLNLKTIFDKPLKRRLLIAFITAAITSAVLIIFIFPDNPIAHRIQNIFSYKDTSFRGRTNEALEVALKIADAKSRLFGVGFGQIKVVGHDVYFNFYRFTYPVVRIPNTLAEALAMFGVIGLSLRLILVILLFFKTRVYNNIYRLAVFIFVFIYQFQGSFMFNIAELAMWAIAFSPAFKQFDRNNLKPKTEQ
jgi:hypothetical protein